MGCHNNGIELERLYGSCRRGAVVPHPLETANEDAGVRQGTGRSWQRTSGNWQETSQNWLRRW